MPLYYIIFSLPAAESKDCVIITDTPTNADSPDVKRCLSPSFATLKKASPRLQRDAPLISGKYIYTLMELRYSIIPLAIACAAIS